MKPSLPLAVTNHLTTIPPLPEGEGRGEGESCVTKQTNNPPIPNQLATIPPVTAVQTAPITPALVDRVSQRLAMGMPLKIALAGEGVKRADYKQYLREHPELEERQDVATQKFLENAFNIILDGENAAANYRWLIELIYPGVLGSEQAEEFAKPKQTIVGLPEDVLERMREHARNAK